MADGDAKPGDKKDDKKEGSALSDFVGLGALEWGVIGIIFFAAVLRIERFFAGTSASGSVGGATSQFTSWLAANPGVTVAVDTARLWASETYRSFVAVSTGFSVLMVAMISYISFRQYEIYKEWRAKIYPQVPTPSTRVAASEIPMSAGQGAPIPANLPTGLPTDFPAGVPLFSRSDQHSQAPNPRWKQVLAHIGSDNPSDWRLAILEADIVLEETLDRAGYVGETLGDKLKSAERRPFNSLNAAWEAHKIRNAIAHQGQGFELNQREASRVVGLFEAVFREFGSA